MDNQGLQRCIAAFSNLTVEAFLGKFGKWTKTGTIAMPLHSLLSGSGKIKVRSRRPGSDPEYIAATDSIEDEIDLVEATATLFRRFDPKSPWLTLPLSRLRKSGRVAFLSADDDGDSAM